MSRIRYLEFRPGRWVKLVDDKVVGPATAEEVDAWKRELAEQAKIWGDVVRHATAVKPQAATVPPEPLPAERPPASDRVEKPQAELAPSPIEALPDAAKAEEAAPAMPPELLLTVEDIRVARRAAEAASIQRVPEAPSGAELVQLESAIEAGPAPAEELAAAVEAQPPVSAAAVTEELRRVEPEAPTVAAAPKQVAEVEPERAVVVAPPRRKRAAKAKAAPREEMPELQREPETMAAPLEEAVEMTAEAEMEPLPAEEAATIEPELETVAAPAEESEEEEYKPSRRGVLTARRRPTKAREAPSTSADRAGQLYLWFMAAPTDDLVMAVRSGLSKYAERFSQPAGVVLCHAGDLEILEKARLAVDVRQGKGVPPRNFWIGPK